MKVAIMLASSAMLALAACGDAGRNQAAADNMVANDMAMNEMAADNAMANAAMPTTGAEYAMMASASDLYEIQSSQLAVEKAQNPQIREFAQMLIKDHEKATADLTAAAAAAQPAIAMPPAALNAEQTANMAALRAASGAEFDQAYLTQQVPAHEKALAMVQGYAANGDVPGFKQHAAAVAGPVERHLARARELSR